MEYSKQSLIILSTWIHPVMGGGELYLEKLIRPQSNFFNIYLISNNKTVIDYLFKFIIPIEEIYYRNNFLFNVASLFKLRKQLGKNHTVVLNGQGAFYYSLFSFVLFKKTVAIQHQLLTAEKSNIKRFLKIIALVFTNKVVTVSKPLADEINIYKSKTTIINNWVNLAFLERILSFKYQIFGDTLNLLYIARVEENKGIKDLVNAIKNVDNVHLTVLGNGTLTDWISSQNLKEKITLAGWQTDIIPFVNESHLLIQPSYVEGLPFVPIEMGVAGLPALLSDIPVHKEISKDGEFAFLFSVGSVESLTEQIKKLSLNRILLMGMSEKIKKHYQDNYLESDKFVNAYRRAFQIID